MFACSTRMFLKDMLSGTNHKNQDIFIESGNELACSINLRRTKNYTSSEKDREKFHDILNSLRALLDEKNIFCWSFPFVLKARHRLDKENLKDTQIVLASESINFSTHKDTRVLSNSELSQTAYTITWRSTDHVLGEATCAKPDADVPFIFDPPMDNRFFIEGH